MSRVDQSAAKRRDFHASRLTAALTWREQVWRLAGWIISELRHANDEVRERVIENLEREAHQLNGSNGGRS